MSGSFSCSAGEVVGAAALRGESHALRQGLDDVVVQSIGRIPQTSDDDANVIEDGIAADMPKASLVPPSDFGI